MTGSKQPDFEAEITILPLGPTTRSSPAYNGVRWNFAFPEEMSAEVSTQAFIWPVFLDPDGKPLASDIPLEGTLKAHMHMVTIDWNHDYARRIRAGCAFVLMEGPWTVATGVVTTVFPSPEMR
jgi:hypothetical protein